MSWDSYIDNLIGQCSGACDQACIIGQDGSLWTTSANAKNLNLTAGEAATIAKAIKDDNLVTFQTSGIVIAGVKYQYLRNLDNVYLGKKKRPWGYNITQIKNCNCYWSYSRRTTAR